MFLCLHEFILSISYAYILKHVYSEAENNVWNQFSATPKSGQATLK